MNVKLKEMSLPDFGQPVTQPLVRQETYNRRIRRALDKAMALDLDALLVYGDREHSANIHYLTGFDPRFEEALLILKHDRPPLLLVGNECWSHAGVSPVVMDKLLFQDFSLLAQPREDSRALEDIWATAGICGKSKVGTAGWKYLTDKSGRKIPELLEIPAYLADSLRKTAASVINATDLFMDAEHGLRIHNELEQLAVFEHAGTICSSAVRDLLFGVKPGMTEFEAVQLMKLNGMPWSCHLMLSSGAKAEFGMSSPSANVIRHGDRFTSAYGLWGSLTSRAGFIVTSEHELPPEIRDYAKKLVMPYFSAISQWYSTIGIGVCGGELYDIIHNTIGDPFFNVFLNPGHQIGTDEWLNSPVFKGSSIELKSGMAMQVDVIPATATAYFMSNIEDGICLADAALRQDFAAAYPEAWERIQRRRDFMQTTLKIRLKPEVLPFSNIPAYLPPFILNPCRAMAVC